MYICLFYILYILYNTMMCAICTIFYNIHVTK